MSARPAGCDSSVLIASLLPDNPLREAAKAAVRTRVRGVPMHALFETYSVLTRLPQQRRSQPAHVVDAIRSLDKPPLGLPPRDQMKLWSSLADMGISGGATYDALVAATAKHHHCVLLSADRRAERTYQAIGVDYEFIG